MPAGRRPNIMRPVKLTTNLPEDLRGQLDLYLFSPVEGCIPRGAYSNFLCERVREFFNKPNEASELEKLKKRIQEADLYEGYTEEQRFALEAFRNHLLNR